MSQSAALCRTVIDWAGPNGVGFSYIVGIGGNADIGFGRVLDWLSRDPGTGAILLDIRRLKDHRAFLSAARAAARLRPVVAMHAGLRLLDDGSGTAELAFEAALRRAGVLSVRRFEDLLAAAETLSRARPARGEALAIVTNTIGAGQLAADAALLDGLRLAPLPDAKHGIVHVPLEAAGSSRPQRRRGGGAGGGRRAGGACAGRRRGRRVDGRAGRDGARRSACRCWSAPWARPPARAPRRRW